MIAVSRIRAGGALGVCLAAGVLVAVRGSGSGAALAIAVLAGLTVVAIGWLVRRTPLVTYDGTGLAVWGRYFGTAQPVALPWSRVTGLERMSRRTLRYLVISYDDPSAGAAGPTGEGTARSHRDQLPYWLCGAKLGDDLEAMRAMWCALR